MVDGRSKEQREAVKGVKRRRQPNEGMNSNEYINRHVMNRNKQNVNINTHYYSEYYNMNINAYGHEYFWDTCGSGCRLRRVIDIGIVMNNS